MILLDNINILRETYPNTWSIFKSLENKIDKDFIKTEETRKGDKTLYINKDNKKIYLHSKYNPTREAEAIVEDYKEIKDGMTVIFYGTGLGYHIKLILEKRPNVKYYIYEPIADLMHHFLTCVNLKDFPKNRLLGINIGTEDISRSINMFVDLNIDEIAIIELPSHKQNFPTEYEDFTNSFREIVKGRRRSLATNYSFQKRWIANSMMNFKDVLSTPNIIIENEGQFKDRPAILVAAGPSLNEEIENIRHIKENGLAYIFSVGSAINTLIHHDIYPHAATTYDPTVFNQKVFEKVKEKGIKEVPMIFGSSVGYETLENYPGKKYHMITSQDTVSNYYLKDKEDKSINIVQDAPSIAVVTVQLLYQLGFSTIILVGQNLAYRGKERHSAGVHYSKEVSEKEMEGSIRVKDVYGNEVLTNEGYNSMRQQIEYYIKELPNINVINTTKGGAHIEGTEFVELEEIIDKNLKEKVVEENWLDRGQTNYDEEYLKLKLEKMDRAYADVLKINRDYYNVIDTIDKLIVNGNIAQAEKMYNKLNRELKKLENNDFYKIFILPMNRVEYKILTDNIKRLNNEKDPYKKGMEIIKSFGKFMNVCAKEVGEIKLVYDKMRADVIEICNIDNGVQLC